MGIICLTKGSGVDANAARASAELFSPHGILVNSNLSNCPDNSLVIFRYTSIHSSLAMYSPWNWLVTSWESLKVISYYAPISKANLNPARRASYSASLFEVRNPSRKNCSSTSPVEVSLIPTPDPCFEEAPCTWRVHVFPGSVPLIAWGVGSKMKSARTCALVHVLVLY